MSVMGRKHNGSSGANEHRVLCVFVPGIKGSVLRCDSCKRRSWPPQFLDNSIESFRRYVSVRSRKIEHMMKPEEAECLAMHHQTVYGVLKKVTFLKGLIKRDIYGEFLTNLQSDCDAIGLTSDGLKRRVELHSFAYDWRNVRQAAEQLLSYLSTTICSFSAIVLVAHSMGGLVCRYMLEELVHHRRVFDPVARQLHHDVKMVYMMGVPHYGSLRSLYHLVDPQNSSVAAHYRNIQSLYDMIPFSDIGSQIEGTLSGSSGVKVAVEPPIEKVVVKDLTSVGSHTESLDTDGVALRRFRSDIFLKEIDGEITVDHRHWLPENSPQQSGRSITRTREADINEHILTLTAGLVSRFPELKAYEARLLLGARVHFALNSSHKPPGCVYICVNAVGVKSPSMIDGQNRLYRDCDNGDGVVCSVVERPNGKHSRYGLGSVLWNKFRTQTDHSVGAVQTESVDATSLENAAGQDKKRFNVHVSMLKSIDVFRFVRLVLPTEICGSGAAGTPWSGKKHIWRTFVDKGSISEVISSSTVMFRGLEVTATNLKSGYCIVNIELEPTDSIGSYSSSPSLEISVTQIPTQTTGTVVHPLGDRTRKIKLRPGVDWSRVTVLLNSYFTISGVRDLQ